MLYVRKLENAKERYPKEIQVQLDTTEQENARLQKKKPDDRS